MLWNDCYLKTRLLNKRDFMWTCGISLKVKCLVKRCHVLTKAISIYDII